MRRRLNIWLVIPFAVIFVYIIITIFNVSVKDGKKWQALANSQQLKSTSVSASRGTIYDSNGTVLAQSATVYTVYADPKMLASQLKAKTFLLFESSVRFPLLFSFLYFTTTIFFFSENLATSDNELS